MEATHMEDKKIETKVIKPKLDNALDIIALSGGNIVMKRYFLAGKLVIAL
jgi:hypothetical protein